MTYPWIFWTGFHLLIALLIAVDMRVFQRKTRETNFKKCLMLTFFWIGIALLFNLFIYFYFGSESALQFFTGYLIEKSLSVDNLFVFLLIFSHFQTPVLYQRRVLVWGILGALVFRISLILAGVALIAQFHWMFYFFGAFLLYSGTQLMLQKQRPISQGFAFVLLNRLLPVAKCKENGEFFVKSGGRWKVTSLFLVLLLIECSDIVFALDSIPAIFAITTDPFIIYTSNVFAILGLRSLYFLLASSLDKLKYLKFGLAAIVIFVGIKMLISSIAPISLSVSLFVILVILAVTILASIRFVREK